MRNNLSLHVTFYTLQDHLEDANSRLETKAYDQILTDPYTHNTLTGRMTHHTVSTRRGRYNPTHWQSHPYTSRRARTPGTINSITAPRCTLSTCLGHTHWHAINASRAPTTRFGQTTRILYRLSRAPHPSGQRNSGASNSTSGGISRRGHTST